MKGAIYCDPSYTTTCTTRKPTKLSSHIRIRSENDAATINRARNRAENDAASKINATNPQRDEEKCPTVKIQKGAITGPPARWAPIKIRTNPSEALVNLRENVPADGQTVWPANTFGPQHKRKVLKWDPSRGRSVIHTHERSV